MRILVSNDDGVNALGIKAIANALNKAGHSVTVVAPSSNRSGFSHSLTIRKEMKFCKGCPSYDEGIEVYSLEGTPADCVKFGSFYSKENPYDLVVSGINDGPNMGYDTMYSGTVGAAMEGANNHTLAIAISMASYRDNTYFDEAGKFLVQNLQSLYEKLTPQFILNINYPNLPLEKVKGIKYTSLGRIFYTDFYQLTENSGENFYSLLGDPIDKENLELDTDIGAVKNGYVSITPLIVDRTCYKVLEELK